MPAARPFALALAFVITAAPAAQAVTDIQHLGSCQKRINSEGAKFAQKVIKSTLKCTTEIDDCLINCEAGVWGPCDSDDEGSNGQFALCLSQAEVVCDAESAKNVLWETQKQDRIRSACGEPNVDPSSLCNATAPGLHFDTLVAGCQALIPGWHCNSVEDVLSCVGGPLQKQLISQMSALLDPRASDAIAMLPAALQAQFSDVPIARRAKEDLPAAGVYDVWALPGLQEGTKVEVRIETRDDTPGSGSSSLEPKLQFVSATSLTNYKIINTNVRDQTCQVANVCGQPCPIFKRSAPDSGTYYVAVSADTSGGCTGGGRYKLVVTTPGGLVPQLVADDLAVTITP
jgi:hypothetical protein